MELEGKKDVVDKKTGKTRKVKKSIAGYLFKKELGVFFVGSCFSAVVVVAQISLPLLVYNFVLALDCN